MTDTATELKENKILEALEALISECESRISEGYSLRSHGQQYPNITRDFFIRRAKKNDAYIHSREFTQSEEFEEVCENISRQILTWSREDCVRLMNSAHNAIAAVLTFEVIFEDAYDQLEPFVINDLSEDLLLKQNELRGRLNRLSTRLQNAENGAGDLEVTVKNINAAAAAADNLPETLETLKKASETASRNNEESKKLLAEIVAANDIAKEAESFIGVTRNEIDVILKNSERALATATSAGLAAAFNAQYEKLKEECWYWVGLLAISLGTASALGYLRLENIFELLGKPGISDSTIVLNLLLSSIIIGAPIWFAWLATKRVGYLFKLREDYGFKATVSTAYEGFRREAANQCDEMERKVLESTLKRFDEAPLRLVDDRVFGSPAHEALNSKGIKSAVQSVVGAVKELTKPQKQVKDTQLENMEKSE